MIEDTKYLPYDFELQLRRAVLEHKVDVASLCNKDGYSLLHFVLIQNRPQFVQPLFRTGCWKALQNVTVAVDKGSEHAGKIAADMVIDMRLRKLQKEMDTYTVWEKSLNLIHVDARVGNLAGVRRWLEYSSDLHAELDCMNCSTLYWACIGGNVDIVKLLLSLRVDYRMLNSRKESLLHAACMMGHHQLIELLVTECGADFTLKDSAKKTPALRASENGDERCLAKLLECGMPRERLGSILAIAGHYGRAAFLQSVVEKYNIDPQSKDDAGKSALHRAAEQGRLEVLRYLFTKNINFEEVALCALIVASGVEHCFKETLFYSHCHFFSFLHSLVNRQLGIVVQFIQKAGPTMLSIVLLNIRTYEGMIHVSHRCITNLHFWKRLSIYIS